jgi:serine/threonine-protein kinase
MTEGTGPDPRLNAQDWENLERIVERFERAWHEGDSPLLQDYLPAAGPGRREVLIELVHADLECRLKAGMAVRAEGYLARYAEVREDRQTALDLIVAEYDFRRRAEAGLSIEEYVRRFPHYAQELAVRLTAAPRMPGPVVCPAGLPLAGWPGTSPAIFFKTVAEFIHLLIRFRLLEPDQRTQLPALRADFCDPRALARELLQRGWLTPFQVNRLFQGRVRELVLGPYLLFERLGSGGMGQVFKARHEDLADRFLAVKLLRKDLVTSPVAMRLFRREIRANIQLAHANVVLALDTGQIDGVPYFAMEYVEGIDLGKLVRQFGPLPCARACDYIRQAAQGLQHAHERGLVHRDIKPSNLMLRVEDGVIKVLDLGLARLILPLGMADASSTVTREGVMVGTPDFMAPEQSLNAHAADIRSDIYSLGCTFYYLLSGQVPFPAGGVAEKLLLHQREEPRPVRELCPATPEAVAEVLCRMMAKRPEDRYRQPAEAAAALAALVDCP